MNESFSHRFLQLLRKNLEIQCDAAGKPVRYLVACSGGPDSVVLLDGLVRLQESLRHDLAVCHVNHGLRADGAPADERFVVELTRKYNVPLIVRRFDAEEVRQIHEGNLEEEARLLRYRKFIETALELDCTHIVTGHTRSDQAETVLLRILRSAGNSGLCGIHPVRRDLPVPVIRPLLTISRKDVIRYAEANRLTFQTDAMNHDPRFTRVKIRHDLLPRLHDSFNPNVEEALARLAASAREDEEFWQEHIDNWIEKIGPVNEEVPANRSVFSRLSGAEQSRLLRALGKRRGLSLSWEQVRESMVLLNGDRPQSEIHLSADWRLYCRYDQFYFAPPRNHPLEDREYQLMVPGVLKIPEWKILVETSLFPANLRVLQSNSGFQAIFDAEKVREPLILRTRRHGDVIRPLGMSGTKKVKKIFQEKKVSLEERERIPCLCFNGDMAWIMGYCLSDSYRITPKTQEILLISVQILQK